MSLEVLLNYEQFYNDIADNLSLEEYKNLKELVENKSCNNCRNGSCRIEQYEKPIENCIGWENRVLVGKEKALKK